MKSAMPEEIRSRIARSISQHGYYILAALIGDKCATCCACYQHDECPLKGDNHQFTDVKEAYVYSVGRREIGVPEIFIFCGPTNNDGPIKYDTARAKIDDAALTIQSLVDGWETVYGWETSRPSNGAPVSVTDGPEYWVNTDQDVIDIIKSHFAMGVGDYYNNNSYDMVVLIPKGAMLDLRSFDISPF